MWRPGISQPIIASAGRHQTCLPSWRKESSARVYGWYVSLQILWGSKDKNFFGHFWLGIFIQDNLPVNFKQEFWPISQLLSGTERKNNQFSRSKFYIQQHAGCCFCCTSMQGQTMLKVHGNLNKGASGSMKLN